MGNYDKSQALVIDPLIYSTYIGGSNYDFGYGIAVDGSGNAYVTGWTLSTDYDVTTGTYQTTNAGGWDVFVTKLNASGSGLMYSTYLGGSDDEVGYGIAVDGSGNAYVTGATVSTNFPVTAGAYQTTFGGGTWDVFVTKISLSPLPIELLAFNVEPLYEGGKGKVWVAWETLTETNNDYFTVERSRDGVNYEEVGRTKGSGNSNERRTYDFIDEFPYLGISYYRLKQTDYDGKYEYFEPKSVEIKEDGGGNIVVCPNPASETVTIRSKEGETFDLMDICGRIIKTFTIQNAIEQIQVNLPSGIYFIREKETGFTQKLVIE